MHLVPVGLGEKQTSLTVGVAMVIIIKFLRCKKRRRFGHSIAFSLVTPLAKFCLILNEH